MAEDGIRTRNALLEASGFLSPLVLAMTDLSAVFGWLAAGWRYELGYVNRKNMAV